MGLHQDAGPAAGTFPETQGVAVGIDMDVLQSQLAELFAHGLCTLFLMEGRCFDAHKLQLLVDAEDFFSMDELQCFLHLFHAGDYVKQLLYLFGNLIIHSKIS